MGKIYLYDTTLRDGAQKEGVSFSIVDKLEITSRLDDMGIHFIEGGWPGSNPRDAEFFENHFLPDLQSRIGKRTLLLTFDEFDNLEESEIKEALGRPLIDHLRRLMGMQGLTFIFSIGSSGRKL